MLSTPSRISWRNRITVRGLLFVAVGGLLAAIGFVIGASKLEEQNPFCTACHTVPEQTYYNRGEQARSLQKTQVVDLASDHFAKKDSFRCIDCHRGDSGLTDRAATLTLGAEDALIFVSGQADPTLEKGQSAQPDLLNRACVQCHTDALLVPGFNNHFHNQLAVVHALAAQSGASSPTGQRYGTAVTCIDCHRAHVQIENGSARKFLDVEGTVYPACEACHKELGRGPLDLAP